MAYVLADNVERRHMSTGQRAMVTASILIDAGRRSIDSSGRMRFDQGSVGCTNLDNSLNCTDLCNSTRAMATAMVLIDDGRRENGKWAYGTLNCSDLSNSTWRNRLMEAGFIVDHRPWGVDSIINGDVGEVGGVVPASAVFGEG